MSLLARLPAQGPWSAPGLFAGAYPQRLPHTWRQRQRDAPGRWLHARAQRLLESLTARREQSAGLDTAALAAVRAAQHHWAQLDDASRAPALHHLRAELARDGFGRAHAGLQARALGCVAAAAQAALQRDPYDTQLQAALHLLNGELAEMATGEGKTLAAALAAAVAGLAGVPVHVMTVNDYLVHRDAEQLRPLYTALGLDVGTVLAGDAAPARCAAYACAITYCTAREVAFDYLRDRLVLADQGTALQQGLRSHLAPQAAPATLLRGLCLAIVDEADSLLIDEATLPLILAAPVHDAAQQAACFQALQLVRGLQAGVHFELPGQPPRVQWLPAGLQALQDKAEAWGGAWLNSRHRQDLATLALQALHGLQRDRDYIVREGAVCILDAHTGRVAEGRQWSRGLHALVALKEGLKPPQATTTQAQISVQGFFSRYLQVCGTSGTLMECREELRALYGLPVRAVPLRTPGRRQVGRPVLFASHETRRAAVVQQLRHWHAKGRPVLVGTPHVAEADALSQALQAAGLPHEVLHARHDADEAAIVARAGQRGAITVATQMAGRGTDILLGEGVAALGGLHVINCQDNRQPRLDRQLIGRGARQGDPGSAEHWLSLQASGHARGLWCAWLARWRPDAQGVVAAPGLLLHLWLRASQQQLERQQRGLRRHLLEQDLIWQQELQFTTLRSA